MKVQGAVVVVTGAARGIGRALAERFAAEGPAGLVLVDRDETALPEVAETTGGLRACADVSIESEVAAVVRNTVERYSRIDLFCSNAGILVTGGVESPDAEWDRIWRVNLMSHVFVARALLPVAQRQGALRLLITASAAGLLTAPGAASYSVTKHAAVSLAEWLAITHAGDGLQVSCLCPQFVDTDMVRTVEGPFRHWMMDGAIPVSHVAETVMAGLSDERFLILPHPEVQEYFQRKASDYDRWLAGMRRLIGKVTVPDHTSVD